MPTAIISNFLNFFLQTMRAKLQELCIDRGLFSDVVFELEDGKQSAHKAILAARCDPMGAMFRGHFRESTAKIVSIILFNLTQPNFT